MSRLYEKKIAGRTINFWLMASGWKWRSPEALIAGGPFSTQEEAEANAASFFRKTIPMDPEEVKQKMPPEEVMEALTVLLAQEIVKQKVEGASVCVRLARVVKELQGEQP